MRRELRRDLADRLREIAIADVPRGARLPALAIPIVVLAGEGARAAELIGAGARGVLRRDCDGARLAAALVAVCAGLVVVDGPLAERALPEPSPLPADDEELTARERQLLTLLASGLSNRRIAERLAISEHTVKFHVSSILAKLRRHAHRGRRRRRAPRAPLALIE